MLAARWAGGVRWAGDRPGAVLTAFLLLHVLVWTWLGAAASPNLQLDLAEDLALGKEWQLSYWKHPPLPWWLADLAYRATGRIDAVYLLGPLSAAFCFLGVYLLAKRVTAPPVALVSVLALAGVHYYNFSVVKFAHDQMQLPFWAFTGLAFYLALTRGRARDWIVSGALLALCFWSKYAAFALAASLGLFLLLDPVARRHWRTPGPYLMALAFLIVLAPNLWGLIQTDFLPFQYVDNRAKVAAHWADWILFPLRWTFGQLGYLAPTLGLLAVLLVKAPRGAAPVAAPDPAFARRYVTLLALGPFLVTTLVAAALGRLPVAMWGYPLWSFLPLAILLWAGRAIEPAGLRRFAAGFAVLFAGLPLIYAAVQWGEPLLRDRPKASDFPGRAFAEAVSKEWHARTNAPLVYVAGSEFAANNVAVYAPERPHVVVHGEPRLSPWIDMDDLRRKGVLIVWEEGHVQAKLDQWAKTFPGMEIGPVIELPHQTLRKTRPARLIYAIVPPRP